MSLCILPFGALAEDVPEGYETIKQIDMGGAHPTGNYLFYPETTYTNEPIAYLGAVPYLAGNVSTSLGYEFCFYELETNTKTPTNYPYATLVDTDFTGNDTTITVNEGAILEFCYAPRNSYDFYGFGYDWYNSGVDEQGTYIESSGIMSTITFSSWLKKVSSCGYINLSNGQQIPIGSYYAYSSGSTYDYYFFRVDLPAGNYRITDFYFTAWYEGTGSSSPLTFRVSDLYIYNKGKVIPSYDEEKYDKPDRTDIDDLTEAEDALRKDADDLKGNVVSALDFTLTDFLDIQPALLAISDLYTQFTFSCPFLSLLIPLSVCLGIVGYLFNLLGGLIHRRGH